MRVWSLLVLFVVLVSFGCGSKSKESLYAEGVKQLKGHNASAAVVFFKSALEKDGNYIDARFQLGKAFVDLGKLDQAEKEFSKVLKQDPSRDEATLELAKVLNLLGKGDEAGRLADQYLAKHPGSSEGLEAKGMALADSKQYEKAEELLRQAVAAAPQRHQAKFALASFYISLGRSADARALLDQVMQADPRNVQALMAIGIVERLAGAPDRAIAAYRKILQIDKDNSQAEYRLGLVLLEKGEIDKVDGMADGLMRRFPKRGEGYRLKGIVSFQRKKYADAIASLQNSIKFAPTVEAYNYLGLCYFNKGDLESALSQFRLILDRIPSSRQARLMIGQILLSQKRVDDAITEIKRVLAQDEHNAMAHNLLGSAYMQQGLFDEGMREFTQATKLDPKLVPAHLKKGAYFFSRGQQLAGESELETAVHAAPDVLSTRLLLASYYLRQGKRDRTLALLQSGLNGSRGDAPLYNAIAQVQFLGGQNEDGVKSLEQAKRVDPSFAGSYRNLATYYAARGDYGRAANEFGVLLQKDPRNVSALLSLGGLSEIRGKDEEAVGYYQKAVDIGSPEAFLVLASYYQKKGSTEKALKVLDNAAKAAPRSLAPLEAKAKLLLGAKKFKEALKTLDEVELINQEQGVALKISAYVAMRNSGEAVNQARRMISKSPTSAKGHVVLATVYDGFRQADAALSEAKVAVATDPKNVEARLLLGHFQEQRKDYAGALASYQDALKLQPDSAPALFARASLWDNTGKKREAVNGYRAVLERVPTFVPALNNLAYLYADGYGNRTEALRLALDAFRSAQGDPRIMDTLGYALLKNGRRDEAVKILEKAATVLPNEPSVQYHLGLAYREAGNRPKAVQALQKSASAGGSDGQAARALLTSMK
ncbi:XrtA/PEP-CTERM system TPR-repeat protein PrsT [Geomesophilobacter sediminis]|uniref:PEP-CTERM system TPR-repeat protein PrsT n=1 Tax=Geomesophilobacter sediminis TaxID=2798584 RepID=A0A8J7JA44_9BACT|nr:XrtA/PEP-CTERM system TPR-repeat protein PrsT [Geomesophilobacter sediminis]MBJ6723666.1 PEP-CTERM system TPR-repeat protein PrsT [Geomesophilobacter sediminis]